MILRILFSLSTALAITGVLQPSLPAQGQGGSLIEAASKSLDGTTTFKAANSNFSLEVPSSWSLDPVKPPYLYSGKVLGGAVNVSVVAEDVANTMSRTDYAQAVLDYVQRESKIKILNYKDEDLQVNGVTALRRTQEVNANGTEVAQIVVIIVEQGKAYTFTASVSQGGLRLFKPVFEKMYNSIWLEGVSSKPIGNPGARRPTR